MLFLVFIVLCVMAVPLLGGRLRNLEGVRFRGLWFVVAALGLQILVISVVALPRGAESAIHAGTYLLAMAFVVANRHIPGLWLIGLGGSLNLIAIVANAGVMPASAPALAAAGLDASPGGFTNSATLAGSKLLLLGDIFAIPESWPIHNVFSIGDICIALGIAYGLQRICGSRLLSSRRGDFWELRNRPQFLRMWAVLAISSLGDWIYALAVGITVARTNGGTHALATLLVAQIGPAVLAGLLGGPIIDRVPRRKLMITSDVIRAGAVGSLLIVGEPTLGHLYAVAACLGLFGALFQPAAQASVPNIVPKRLIVAANSILTATTHMAIMAGPILGGLLLGQLGLTPALIINALTFVASAVLVMGLSIPGSSPEADSGNAVRDLVEGLRYSIRTPLVRGILLVTGLVMLAAAIKAPLEPLFVLRELGGGAESLGLIGGAWGLGMLLGSAIAPRAAQAWRRERLLAVGIAIVGVCVAAASQAATLTTVLTLWLFAGAANALGTISYESLLQERTPDHFRGRVIAASEATLDMMYLSGVLLSGWLGDVMGVRHAYLLSGSLFLLTAIVCHATLKVRAPVSVSIDGPQAHARPNEPAMDLARNA